MSEPKDFFATRDPADEIYKDWCTDTGRPGLGLVAISLQFYSVQNYPCSVAQVATAFKMAEAAAVADSGPAQAFRELVTRVTVHPNYELEISGNLAPLLGVQMVAGERSEHLPPESRIIPFIIKAAA